MNGKHEEDIYSRFISWLDKGWWNLPASEHLLPSIKAFYTVEEARLLTGFPFKPTELKELALLKGIDPAELAKTLDALASKGAIWRTKRGDTPLYHLNDAFFIFFRGPLSAVAPDPAARAMARPVNRYVRDGLMDQLAPARTKPLRTIPIGKTVEDPRRIMPYEDVMSIVESQDFLAVTKCACRQRKNLDPDSARCKHPEEVCLHFKALAHYLVDTGIGREITKEEAKHILKLSADAGLVHAVSNRQQDADTICNCCTCACIFFESYHALKHDRSHDFSNYRLRIEPSTCQACGLCVKRCPVQVLGLKDSSLTKNQKGKAAALMNPDQCLGCGVCVHKCPSQSLILELRREIHDPPKDALEWRERLIQDQALAAKQPFRPRPSD
ncbi:MAG: 4Fe-4S dicluster domain-containing protein [Deltaproteobacteria bacterium]